MVNLLNLSTFQEEYYCSYNLKDKILGWAGEAPCEPATPCEIAIDLDGDDSAGLSPWDYRDSIYCGPEDIPLTDLDAVVYADKPWDSVSLSIISPPVSSASLSGMPVPGITISGNGTANITLLNTSDVAPGVLAGQLTQLSLNPDPGIVNTVYRIACVGYADDLVSDTAFAHLYVGTRSTTSGPDVSIVLCRDLALYSLQNDLPPNATPGGVWSDPAPDNGLISLENFQTSTFYYIVEEPNCPPDSALWEIVVEEPPQFDLGNDTVLCAGDVLTLAAPSGFNILWQDGSQALQQTITESGLYWLEVITDQDCRFRDSVFVQFWDEILLDTTIYLCSSDTAVFMGETFSIPGSFELQVSNQDACDTLWMIDVNQEVEEFHITVQGTLCDPRPVTLFAPSISGAVYHWSNGGNSPFIEVSEENMYSVTVMYGDDCFATDSILISACEEPKFFIPNVFSPNGDGINDHFQVFGKEIAEVDLQIFDRWGDDLYHDISPAPAWDGKNEGKNALPGVYVYLATITFQDGREMTTYGSVTLVR